MIRTVLLLDDQIDTVRCINECIKNKKVGWDLLHVDNIQDALRCFKDQAIDQMVVRTGVPIPPNSSFWEEVVKRSPQTVRVVIASHLDVGQAPASFQYAHQYLSQSLPPSKVIELIDYISSLQKELANLRLEAEIGGLQSLQTVPDNFIGIIKELQAPEPSVKRIASLIEKDMAMTARIMQLVNSAFFSLPNRVTKVDQAVGLLGIAHIRSMLISMQMFSVFEGGPIPKRHVEKVWEHSVQVAGLAREIAAREGLGKDEIEAVMLAGMLHDLGKLVLFKLPEYRAALVKCGRDGKSESLDIERELYGSTHAEAGAYLIGIWGLDPLVVDMVMNHHTPRRSTKSPGFSGLSAVYISNLIINSRSRIDGSGSESPDLEYLAGIGAENGLERWMLMGP